METPRNWVWTAIGSCQKKYTNTVPSIWLNQTIEKQLNQTTDKQLIQTIDKQLNQTIDKQPNWTILLVAVVQNNCLSSSSKAVDATKNRTHPTNEKKKR